MKTSINFLILFFSVQIAHASCMAGFSFYPQSPTLTKNTQIIIEAYVSEGYFQFLKDLDSRYPIYLKSQNRKIRLRKKILITGQYESYQAIFKPEELLTAGETYELDIPNLREADQRYGRSMKRIWREGKYRNLSWLAIDKTDSESPELIQTPIFSKSTLAYYGCGPAVFSTFTLKAKDESEILVLTELLELESGKSSSYFLTAREGELWVGHHMCAGGFVFQKRKKYKIRVKLYDMSGNTNDTWSDWTSCENPWDEETG